jgi:hypothetical protein
MIVSRISLREIMPFSLFRGAKYDISEEPSHEPQ